MLVQTRSKSHRRRLGRLKYLLRDEFFTALAAGSVNGTPAEPGPGTRTVVDANSKISIAGGDLKQDAQGSAIWTQYLRYGSITRTAGRIMLVKHYITTASTFLFGVSAAADIGVVASYEAAIPSVNAGVIRIWEGSSGPQVGSVSATNTYQMAIVLRTDGAYYFVKGGAFTNWTLLWTSLNNNTATLYPFSVISQADVLTTYIRVPDELWLPQPLLSDAFTRANGVLGNTDGAGHAELNGGGGLAWANKIGTTQIATNVASASALVGGIAIATVDAGNINVLHEAELTRSAGNVGIVLRYADADNYIYAIHDGTNAKLIKRVATAETTVITAVTAYAAGAVMRVICDGTSFSLFYNNAKIGSTSTISDASLQTGTEHGLYSSNVGNSQDDMVTWLRKASAYDKLDDF